ncbi:uncharacterized protein BDR25DRAFT_318489 [Lindgomyces ingoldianus]|uniref:Uncharacterized protein n=1 Tax=Lindgomyces ingoldianus TaxID=673940 RepID=A0ACB6QFA7_9PLEO|nr:uncharacterized protein BDR25DRAFT_318489 [Lindgomyces ingoldianus]KAF2465648.1 hypothetical protein BDR25DRAFT_318489 [Lindgomyces ingoldianus]
MSYPRYVPQGVQGIRVPIDIEDTAIALIPTSDIAIPDFNSVPFKTQPWRDVPSIIITHLQIPNPLSPPDPNWESLLRFFLTPQPNVPISHGHGNLQDLYMLVTRIVIPNLIITNRVHIWDMYLTRGNLTTRCLLRYDAWDFLPRYQQQSPAVTKPRLYGDRTGNPRAILRSYVTPDGDAFLAWLNAAPQLPPQWPVNTPIPSQMAHHPSVELDVYLHDSEDWIRGMDPRILLQRLERVLEMFWWLASNNARLEQFRAARWEGVETYCLA